MGKKASASSQPLKWPEPGKLSTAELLEAIFLRAGKEEAPFTEEAVYRFFARLADKYPALKDRFRLSGTQERLSSEPLRRALSFFEMGKLLVLPEANPVPQYYRVRKSQLRAVEKDLTERGVLPRYESLVEQLGQEFVKSLGGSAAAGGPDAR